MNLVETRPALRSLVAMELHSVFPSSTAPALTTLATGLWPGRHAVTSWWTHLPKHGVTATILPYVDRFEEKPLAVPPEDAFPEPSRMRAEAHSFFPLPIVDSVYSRWVRRGTPASGYRTLPEAVDGVIQRVREGPGYTYLYYPGLDSAEHKCGVFSSEATAQLDLIEREILRLRGHGRLVVSADHGQLDVPDSAKHFLAPDDPLVAMLEHPPAGEPRALFFRTKDPRFPDAFRSRFPAFDLRTVDEAATLFGGLTPETRARIGDWIAIAREPAILLYGPPKWHLAEAAMRGFHGGLAPEEVRVPLLLA